MANYQNKARMAKEDEFYTQLSDIERELKRYKDQLRGKTIFCNCDDPETSEFYYYFVSNFDILGLKRLITTHFEVDKPSYKLEYSGGADTPKQHSQTAPLPSVTLPQFHSGGGHNRYIDFQLTSQTYEQYPEMS